MRATVRCSAKWGRCTGINCTELRFFDDVDFACSTFTLRASSPFQSYAYTWRHLSSSVRTCVQLHNHAHQRCYYSIPCSIENGIKLCMRLLLREMWQWRYKYPLKRKFFCSICRGISAQYYMPWEWDRLQYSAPSSVLRVLYRPGARPRGHCIWVLG